MKILSRNFGLMPFLLVVCGCIDTPPTKFTTTTDGGQPMFGYKDLSPAQAIVLATSCLVGTGLFAKTIYVQYSSTTNNEKVVDFYEDDKSIDFAKETDWHGPCVRVRVSSDRIRIEGTKKPQGKLSFTQMELEKAVVIATAWAVKDGEAYERYSVSPAVVGTGQICVSFNRFPQTCGGHLSVIFRENEIYFVGGA